MTNIPFMQPLLDNSDARSVYEQVMSGFIGPGKAVKLFGEDLARQNGRLSCLLTTSGTVALSVAALSAGLQKGDEILVPAYGVISTIQAFSSVGLIPRLVDIDINTASIFLDDIKKSLTRRTRAICHVNFAGNIGHDLIEIEQFCEENNLVLIEDAACSMGNSFEGRQAGSFGDVSIFSMSVPKVITTGQGGAILSNNKAIIQRATEIMDLGDANWRDTNLNRGIGNNLRYTDLQAALGASQLKLLEKKLANRKAVFSELEKKIKNRIYKSGGDEAPLYNIVLSEKREKIKNMLQKHGVNSSIQYRAIYEHPPYSELNIRNFPGAEYWSKRALFLPFGNGLTTKQSIKIGNLMTDLCPVLHKFVPIDGSELE